ncbi:MAG: hypothetical protein GC182_21840 [Rhodopseudomonas sp.]|nr:hypothetical protein [Rhodopseudomonas sp.]
MMRPALAAIVIAIAIAIRELPRPDRRFASLIASPIAKLVATFTVTIVVMIADVVAGTIVLAAQLTTTLMPRFVAAFVTPFIAVFPAGLDVTTPIGRDLAGRRRRIDGLRRSGLMNAGGRVGLVRHLILRRRADGQADKAEETGKRAEKHGFPHSLCS